MMSHTLLVIDVTTAARADQAWRAALGATLAGGVVQVVVTPTAQPFCQSALAQRARQTLEAFGHCCETATLAQVESKLRQHIEVWR